ncbi:efflux RND transporter periplasmic adaptor subunit [Roseinatronobacter sp. NSM]|uniref:efflux RND transporter periplasmic adaptor subunit n=1 Tax=Roseinatronobacter sp. NSM TaxID=3457785 RepID=UPI004036BC4B
MGVMRKLGLGLAGAGVTAALVWALWPQPMPVDLAMVTRGPMQGVIVAQGVTRVRNPYAITAPITGATTRSPVEVGDQVIAGETVVAVIQPADPALMDARARAQAEAAVAEAQAAIAVAQSNLRQAESGLEHSKLQLERARTLADGGTIPLRMLEDIEVAHLAAQQTLDAARSQLDLKYAALARAQAQLLGPQALYDPDAEPGACCVQLLAPQSGIVLEVSDQSARFVQAGGPLLTIGNLDEMEIELDLLSTDAVRVPDGARAIVERWGGEGVLSAQLRRVDPAAFTRVSALGIEEQRVRVRLDLLSPPEDRKGLGDGFRVHVRLIIWDADDLVRVPQAALFRDGDGWAVFVVDAGRARHRRVEIGRQAAGQAEVLTGLDKGAMVVLYPGSALADGQTIVARD